MATSIAPILATTDLDRLLRFYTGLLGAVEVFRTPADGPAFYLGLRVGRADLGLVANSSVQPDTPQRILLNADVEDVDALLDRVAGLGGRVLGPPNDMPWGQRVAHVQDPDGNAVNLSQPIPPPR